MKVICTEDCDTLVRTKKYPVISETKTCYYLKGDDGVKRFYLKNRFEEVEEMLNGKFVVEEETKLFRKGNIVEFINGNASIDYKNGGKWIVLCVTNVEALEKGGLKLKPYEEPKEIRVQDMEEGKRYKNNLSSYEFIKEDEILYCFNHRDEKVLSLLSYNKAKSMIFTEINPNKERIEELKGLIKEKNKEVKNCAIKVEENIYQLDSLKHLLNSYEAELKELTNA